MENKLFTIVNKEDEAKSQVNAKALDLLGLTISKFSQDAVTERTVSICHCNTYRP